MGLWIVHKIVTAHSGTISVSSEGINKGTTFTLKFDCFQESSNTQSKSCIVDMCEIDEVQQALCMDGSSAHGSMMLRPSFRSGRTSFLGSANYSFLQGALERFEMDTVSQTISQKTDHKQTGSFSVVAAPAQPHAELNDDNRRMLELRVLIVDDVSACRKILGIIFRIFCTLSSTDHN